MLNKASAAHMERSHAVHFVELPLACVRENRAAHSNVRTKAGRPSGSSSDGPKDNKTVWMGRRRGYFGVVYWDRCCHQTGHVVLTDGTCGVIGRDTLCRQTGARVGTVG